MHFEWDEEKNKINLIKHGIWFEEVQSVFQDPNAMVFLDEINSICEERFIIIGNNAFGINLIVVHCYCKDDDIIRIISARKTTKKERLIYEERV